MAAAAQALAVGAQSALASELAVAAALMALVSPTALACDTA